jgi:hypothetical protein
VTAHDNLLAFYYKCEKDINHEAESLLPKRYATNREDIGYFPVQISIQKEADIHRYQLT